MNREAVISAPAKSGTGWARNLVYAGAALAMCLVLPFLTGQIPQIGSALCPMHIPVLLAGFLCGPWWAAAVGAAAPLLRFALFGMPPLFPTGLAMCFELAAYGLASGLLSRTLPRTAAGTYGSLVGAMLLGRVVWGAAQTILMGLSGSAFTWAAFLSGAFFTAVPGIIVQLVLIPPVVLAMRRAGFIRS